MPVMTRAQAADAAARQQHETLGGLIAQLRQLERDVGSEAYVVYYTSRADAARLVLHMVFAIVLLKKLHKVG